VKVKENIKCFFRKDPTSFFYVASCISFAASPLVNCDVSRLELVKNMMQTMHITYVEVPVACFSSWSSYAISWTRMVKLVTWQGLYPWISESSLPYNL